jgi:uncharacterized protein (TIGR02147 family)
MVQVLDFTDYQLYLAKALEELSKTTRGVRSRLAEAIGVHPSYVTTVLSGTTHLSPEQSEKVSRYFGHSDEESHYFFLLVSQARAGTEELKALLEKQLRAHRKDYLNLKKRFSAENQLSEANLATFYSSWQYSAVATALTIPRLQTKEALSEHFKLPLKRIAEILAFLEKAGIIRFEKGKFKEFREQHIVGNPAMIARDHSNWRLYAIRSYEDHHADDVHYSSVVTLSEEDVFRIKKMILKTIDEAREIIRPSKEEKLCSFQVDFFEI